MASSSSSASGRPATDFNSFDYQSKYLLETQFQAGAASQEVITLLGEQTDLDPNDRTALGRLVDKTVSFLERLYSESTVSGTKRVGFDGIVARNTKFATNRLTKDVTGDTPKKPLRAYRDEMHAKVNTAVTNVQRDAITLVSRFNDIDSEQVHTRAADIRGIFQTIQTEIATDFSKARIQEARQMLVNFGSDISRVEQHFPKSQFVTDARATLGQFETELNGLNTTRKQNQAQAQEAARLKAEADAQAAAAEAAKAAADAAKAQAKQDKQAQKDAAAQATALKAREAQLTAIFKKAKIAPALIPIMVKTTIEEEQKAAAKAAAKQKAPAPQESSSSSSSSSSQSGSESVRSSSDQASDSNASSSASSIPSEGSSESTGGSSEAAELSSSDASQSSQPEETSASSSKKASDAGSSFGVEDDVASDEVQGSSNASSSSHSSKEVADTSGKKTTEALFDECDDLMGQLNPAAKSNKQEKTTAPQEQSSDEGSNAVEEQVTNDDYFNSFIEQPKPAADKKKSKHSKSSKVPTVPTKAPTKPVVPTKKSSSSSKTSSSKTKAAPKTPTVVPAKIASSATSVKPAADSIDYSNLESFVFSSKSTSKSSKSSKTTKKTALTDEQKTDKALKSFRSLEGMVTGKGADFATKAQGAYDMLPSDEQKHFAADFKAVAKKDFQSALKAAKSSQTARGTFASNVNRALTAFESRALGTN
ncbi:MAG: hypothetical protein K2P51_01035 [Rhabdochlamydiaceae bacterium]|nr:hypothetical protein [Rhabdochlamydiaceae bacterium]